MSDSPRSPRTHRGAAAIAVALALVASLAIGPAARADTPPPRPTIVLVHGAFANPAGWDAVRSALETDGYTVVAPQLGLRSLAGDVAIVRSALSSISGPIVLVGHSYGGAVITNAAAGNPNVKALVYIAAFVPEVGETSLGLSTKYPGSVLPVAIVPTPILNQGRPDLDVRVNPLLFRYAFTSNEVSPATARAMAATQGPITLSALLGKTTAAAWHTIPSWQLVSTHDHAIAPALQHFEVKRDHAHELDVASGHAAMVSHPDKVTGLILDAVAATG